MLNEDTLRRWIGRRTEVAVDVIDERRVADLAATLDEGRAPARGDALPELWHWMLFAPMKRPADLGRDGHPQLGDFLPPVPHARRMWAGGRLQFHAPLRVGQTLRRTSEVADVRLKTGRSGTLVFVTVRHLIHRGRRAWPVLTEEHDIVYRPMDAAHASTPTAVPASAPATASPASAATPRMRHTVAPDPVLLFRYSALTANGHRIHYDGDYARQVEGYPGLVVHGPLIVTLLLQLLRRQGSQPRLHALEYRALHPAFEPGLLHLNGAPGETPSAFDLWATDDGGTRLMQARAHV